MNVSIKTVLTATMLALGTTSVYADVTGNMGVVSNYILRGMTDAPESNVPALQGGLDWTDKSGLFLGYWFSTLSYNYESLSGSDAEDKGSNSFENDLYGGYNGKIGDLGYTLAGTIYYYSPGWESTGYETNLGLNYKNFTFNAKTLLNDVTFGNKGDTYWLATYTQPLPQKFTMKAELGAYTYGDSDAYLCGAGGSCKEQNKAAVTEESTAFRHFTLGLTHPISTNGTLGLQYIVGGKLRTGYDQDDKVVASLGFTF